jgi:cytochrome c556
MLRKWMCLPAVMITVTALTVGISMADDEDSPLHKLMEQVQAKNLIITKGVRNAAGFKKAQQEVADSAEDLVKLAKQARDMKDAVKKAKDVPNADGRWNELMDSFASTSKNLATVAGKSSSTQVQAKEAFAAVKKVCADCHKDFRVEDEGF